MDGSGGYYLFDQDHVVGYAEIDAQHRRMVYLLANASQALRDGADRNAVQGMFDEYVAYTQFHFRSEERLMQQQGYARRAQHMQIHATLLSQLATLQRNFADDDPQGTLAAAYEWLLAHIERSDKDLGAFLRGGPSG